MEENEDMFFIFRNLHYEEEDPYDTSFDKDGNHLFSNFLNIDYNYFSMEDKKEISTDGDKLLSKLNHIENTYLNNMMDNTCPTVGKL